MSEFPWFRFYSETLTDKKIRRVCRDTGACKATVIGVWVVILALASESPERGKLLISADIPLTADDIHDETGIDRANFDALVAAFVAYGMLDTDDDCWEVCNWEKRQPNSDNSTARVRKFRAKKQGETGAQLPTATRETFQKRSSNVIDTDTDIDKEGEKNARTGHKARPPATQRPVSVFSPPHLEIQFSEDKTRRTAEAHMVRALADVSGMDGTLNIAKLLPVAKDLLDTEYTPDQVRAAYGRDAPPGRWSWYGDDWRGRKGDRPTLPNIVETVGNAKQTVQAKSEGGTLWIDHAQVFES